MTHYTKVPKILLCGYERGGTTLLSEVFRANGYFSGFETGILLCENPADFLELSPFNKMLAPGWKIPKDEVVGLCEGDFAEFYEKLIGLSLKNHGNNNIPAKFFDKTPAYMRELGRALNRTSFINKGVVITRDPRQIFFSWAKRQCNGIERLDYFIQRKLDNYANRYLNYFIGSITHRKNPNVLFISFDDLVINFEQTVASIGSFADGSPFTNYLLNPRFKNVARNIDKTRLTEYEEFMPVKLQEKILRRTGLAAPFFGDHRTKQNYIHVWEEKKQEIETILRRFEIDQTFTEVVGDYFEPETYLLRYPELLKKQADPREHYRLSGKKQGKKPA